MEGPGARSRDTVASAAVPTVAKMPHRIPSCDFGADAQQP